MLKLARQDEAEFQKYLSAKRWCESRKHVAHVAHMKAQIAIGRNLAEQFMAENVFLQEVADVAQVPNFGPWIAGCLKRKKLKQEHAILVVVTDYSKCGVARQRLINRHTQAICSFSCGLILQPLLYGAGSGCSLLNDMRTIEDTLFKGKQELRKICTAVDLSQCHGNRSFVCS